jgi:L-amino acid N-acyltransferase YncA
MRIGLLQPADWDSVRSIYLEGIASGLATFGIFAVNAASLALHRACGFREVGIRERIGRLEMYGTTSC